MRHIGVIASSCKLPSVTEICVIYMIAKSVAKILGYSMISKFFDVPRH